MELEDLVAKNITHFIEDLVPNSVSFFQRLKTIRNGSKPAKTKQCLKNVYPRCPSAEG